MVLGVKQLDCELESIDDFRQYRPQPSFPIDLDHANHHELALEPGRIASRPDSESSIRQ